MLVKVTEEKLYLGEGISRNISVNSISIEEKKDKNGMPIQHLVIEFVQHPQVKEQAPKYFTWSSESINREYSIYQITEEDENGFVKRFVRGGDKGDVVYGEILINSLVQIFKIYAGDIAKCVEVFQKCNGIEDLVTKCQEMIKANPKARGRICLQYEYYETKEGRVARVTKTPKYGVWFDFENGNLIKEFLPTSGMKPAEIALMARYQTQGAAGSVVAETSSEGAYSSPMDSETPPWS